MNSDNWNFLAKLLDTPGSADPPAEEQQETDSTTAKNDADSAAGEDSPAPKAKQPTRESGKTRLLDALKAKIPPNILPGFGTASSDQEEKPASPDPQLESVSKSTKAAASSVSAVEDGPNKEPADSTENASQENLGGWNDVASELGIEETVERDAPRPVQRNPSQLDQKSAATKKARPAKKKSSEFATGLGFDTEEEQTEEEEAEPQLAPDKSNTDPLASASAFGEPSRDKSTGQSTQRNEPRKSRNRDRNESASRGRSQRGSRDREDNDRNDRDTRTARPAGERGQRSESPSDSGEDSKRPGRTT